MASDKTKILIIRLSALGDTIHTIPLAYSLKKNISDIEIGWIVEDKAKQFIKSNPLIDKCFIIPKKRWKKRGFSLKNIMEFFAIIRKIQRENYDIVIDTQQLFKSSVLMAFLNIKRKITHNDGREFSWLFANEFITSKRKQFDINYHVVKRNLEFAKYLGVNNEDINFELPDSTPEVKEYISNLIAKTDSSKKILVLAPATTWQNKHWKNAYWRELVQEYKYKCNIIMTGSSIDSRLINDILQDDIKDNVINLSGKTDLSQLSELLKYADIVISPDSGTAHIAWAAGKPAVITIFTATSPERTGPWGDKYFSIGAQTDCAPCMKRKCKNIHDENACTSAIMPDKIINIINKLLQ